MKDINAYLQTDDIHSVFIAPDVSDKTLLYIMFSDFVRLKQGLIRALKVKCLALDLDETIWKGVLIEDGPSGVEVNQELISYLQRFKEKGVILSVISKNNFDQAMACLRQHQLENLFVFPQMSWEPKSINLKRLANALGIDSGAIVLVDDSSFERAEVETNFNSVRTIHPDEVGNFYNSKEVQEMVITNDSAKRTEYYKTEEARQKALQDTGNKEEAFLRSLNAKIEILNVTDKNITRAHELVQRTNRLNFTNHRYTQEEINNFLETKDRFVCRLISVKDRFGDYGVVGFFILEKTNEKEWFIKDLMFSCRIQGRHIDIFVLQKILENAQRHNIKKVKGILSLSTKNANAKEVYLSANFRQTQEEGGILSFEFNFEHQQVLTNDYITTVGDSNF